MTQQVKKYRCIKDCKNWEHGEVAMWRNPDPEYWELIEESQEPSITKEENELLKTWFEQNFLDGDKIQGGQMISSAEFFEAMCDAVSFLKNSQLEKQQEESQEDIQEERAFTMLDMISKPTQEDAVKSLFKLKRMGDEPHFTNVLIYLKNSQPTMPSVEWEEINNVLYQHIRTEEFYNLSSLEQEETIINFFKPHFLALQQRAEQAEQRVKELEERESFRMIRSDAINRKNIN